jgi:hypothetical protein
MKGEVGVEGSNPLWFHTSVSRVSDIAESRWKSARVRAIRDQAQTQRTPPERRIVRIWQTYPGAILLGPRIIAVDLPGAGTPDHPKRDRPPR